MIKVAKLSEIPQCGSKLVMVGDTPVALFNIKGKIHAWDNRCPHRGASLADGNITENGYSDEEMKFSNESKKILDIPDLNVEPSNARVGVETGHGIFCTATFEKDVDVESAIESLEAFEGVEYWKETYPTPLDAQGNKNILVSRMRSGLTSNKILNFWAVGDNLLKGAALNAVQIANHLYKNDFYTK